MAEEHVVSEYPSIIGGGEVEGAGMSTMEELVALQKALDTGDYVTAVSGTTGGAALRVQSLEGTLKVLTFTEKNAVLWQNITKLPAYSTIEEYNELNSYGTQGGSFIPQGVAPQEDDSVYTRRASYVKYMGTTRKVTHPMMLVNTMVGDIVARENRNGTLKIIRDVENALFWGDSTRVYRGEGLEFDGLARLIDPDNVLDLNNTNLTEGAFEDAAELVADGYGYPTDAFISNRVASSLAKTLLPKGRAIYPASTGGIRAGMAVTEVATQHGVVTIRPSVFLNIGRSPKATPPTTATSPLAPTSPASITPGPMTGSGGKFRSASQIGTFKFQATACNRFGESAPCPLSTGVAVTSADLTKVIPLTITNADSISVAPEWFNIYATEPDGSTTYLIGFTPASSQAPGGTTVYHYDGRVMANTSVAFVGQLDGDTLAFKQLAPLMSMDLAVTEPAKKWMILLYGVLQLYYPKKWVKIINIKDTV